MPHQPHLGNVLFVLGHVGCWTEENCQELLSTPRLYILELPGSPGRAGLDTAVILESGVKQSGPLSLVRLRTALIG